MAQATIVLEIFKSGIHLACEDTGHDEFIPHGDGNKLVDLINEIELDTDPDATFTITPKGEYVNKLMKEGFPFEEACEMAENKYPSEDEKI